MALPDDQPQSADLGSAVQLDNAETLVGPAGGADPLDAGYIPPDRPYVLDEDGVTGAGMRDGESLDDRLAREQPEEQPVDDDRSGRLVADGSDVDAVDVGVDGGAASAEEAAVHDVGDGGEPVETEPSVLSTQALSDPEADAEVDAADAGEPAAFGDALRDVANDGEFTGPDRAADIDAARDAAGVAAPASGRDDL